MGKKEESINLPCPLIQLLFREFFVNNKILEFFNQTA